MSDTVPAVPPVVSPPSPVILFDGKTYNVIDGPDDNSPLVQVAHDQILQTLEIDKLVRNLNRTDDLLHTTTSPAWRACTLPDSIR